VKTNAFVGLSTRAAHQVDGGRLGDLSHIYDIIDVTDEKVLSPISQFVV
jgi:hypothetical protein